MLLTARQEAAAIMLAAIKRITHACKQLLLGLLDYSDLTDEHVSTLYTQVVKEFFFAVDLFEANEIDMADIKVFPDNLRIALEAVFEQANSPDDTEDVNGEEINNLIAQLVRSLQEKHRQFINHDPITTTDGETESRTPSVLPASEPSDPHVQHNGTDKITKLYLQIHDEVKRVKCPFGLIDIDTIRRLFMEKFPYILSDNLDHFPKLYIRDTNSQVFYELEDMADIVDESLLKLIPATIEKPTLITSPQDSISSQQSPRKIPKYQIDTRLQKARSLRQDLGTLKSNVNEFRKAFTLQLSKTQTQILTATASSPSTLNRSIIAGVKTDLVQSTTALSERLADLFDVVEQMRMDTIQRSAIPSLQRLEYVMTETETLIRMSEKSSTQLSGVVPIWKQTWESELQGVVEEQEFIKHTETLLDESKGKLTQINALTKQLRRVADIAVSNPSAAIPKRQFRPVVPDEGFEGFGTVMSELIEAVDINHTRRMKALQRAEKIRSWEKENGSSSGDELAWELKKAAKDRRSALKSVGGFQEIERQREMRDALIRKELAAAAAQSQ